MQEYEIDVAADLEAQEDAIPSWEYQQQVMHDERQESLGLDAQLAYAGAEDPEQCPSNAPLGQHLEAAWHRRNQCIVIEEDEWRTQHPPGVAQGLNDHTYVMPHTPATLCQYQDAYDAPSGATWTAIWQAASPDLQGAQDQARESPPKRMKTSQDRPTCVQTQSSQHRKAAIRTERLANDRDAAAARSRSA